MVLAARTTQARLVLAYGGVVRRDDGSAQVLGQVRPADARHRIGPWPLWGNTVRTGRQVRCDRAVDVPVGLLLPPVPAVFVLQPLGVAPDLCVLAVPQLLVDDVVGGVENEVRRDVLMLGHQVHGRDRVVPQRRGVVRRRAV
ncbi:hypothetical protein GCM10027176_38350 [Actinoallomurus bryophytorum]